MSEVLQDGVQDIRVLNFSEKLNKKEKLKKLKNNQIEIVGGTPLIYADGIAER